MADATARSLQYEYKAVSLALFYLSICFQPARVSLINPSWLYKLTLL